ncbi:glutamate racemase [Halomonas cerina]|uniref:Glutamate racemase n=1 Tax=Halomonas cerina TaxID=447424 RepID=A0A839VC07_9GAMM|nr:glutamate racemase [Halomonas cerina]MBB3191545.1 glutamate racemase [Halomonas cerina]
MPRGPVLVFDSGVGGLSMVGALCHHLPGVALAYACDNAMLPYGIREDDWLVARILAVCEAAVLASGASALVVACNTASTLALAALRARLRIPVVGTVPAIKPAARLSRSRHIGLLATRATVARPYTLGLIREFAADCRVLRVAADVLVNEAERLVAGEPPDRRVLRRALAPLRDDPQLDTVVLGCTHFPLLREALAEVSPPAWQWVDSGEAIARRTAQVVADPALRGGPGASFATAPDTRLARGLAAFGFASPKPLPVG